MLHIDPSVLKLQDYIVGMRRYFHAHPEVSLKEFKTSERIKAELDAAGIDYEGVGETGVCARIKGKKPLAAGAKPPHRRASRRHGCARHAGSEDL